MTRHRRIPRRSRAPVARATGIASRAIPWSAPVAVAALAAALAVAPSVARAGDPPCSSLYPSGGPGGVDLKGACVADAVVQNYVSPGATSDLLWAAGVILAASWMAALVLYGAWRWVARRNAQRLAPTAPVAFWLCEACRSFNAGDTDRCYRCHRARPADPPTVDATVPPSWDQRFGRPPGL